MIKLFKRERGKLRYHEAWGRDGNVTEHLGEVGDRGRTREHTVPRGGSADAVIAEVLKPARDRGYAEIDIEDHFTLLVEFAINDEMGEPGDLDKRYRLQDRMDESLGWTGLGHCDGGSIGMGTMEVCCLVVDFEIAKRVIAADLEGTEFADYSRIFDENAE